MNMSQNLSLLKKGEKQIKLQWRILLSQIQNPKLRTCLYLSQKLKKFQKQNPGFEGSLSLDVTIDVCGDVVGMTEIASTTGYPRFNNEVKSSLSRQKYPKTTQGHYTLSFTLKFVNQVPVSEKGNVKPLPQSPADSVAEN